MKQTKIYIYGKHAVAEALAHVPKAVTKVYVDTRTVEKGMQSLIAKAGVPTGPLALGQARSDLVRGTAHQGLMASLSLHELLVPYGTFVEKLEPRKETMLVLLCGVEDPHNVGAIIRTAAGFGAAAVLIPTKHQAPVTGAVVKASAGMAMRIPLVPIESIEETLRDLKKRGFSVYGFAGGSGRPLMQEAFNTPAVFVFGNEAIGLSKPIRALCSSILSIPLNPRCESLNVAAAAAAALFAWSSQNPAALAHS